MPIEILRRDFLLGLGAVAMMASEKSSGVNINSWLDSLMINSPPFVIFLFSTITIILQIQKCLRHLVQSQHT